MNFRAFDNQSESWKKSWKSPGKLFWKKGTNLVYDVNMSTKSKTESKFSRVSFREFFKTWQSCNHMHFL